MTDTATPPSSWMEEELDPSYYLRKLRRHWILLLVCSFTVAAAALLVASFRPVQYEGVTTILIGRSNSGIASATSRAMLENHTLAGQTLTEIGSAMSPQSFMLNNLVVEQVAGTNVMKVRVRLADAAQAAQASRVLSQKAVELNRRVASEEGTAVREQLKGLLDEATDRLKSAEDQYVRYQDQAQIDLLKKDTEKMIAERGDLLKLRLDIETEKARLAATEREIQKQERILPAPRAVAAEAAFQRSADRAAAADAADEVIKEMADQMADLKSIRDAERRAAPDGKLVAPSTRDLERRSAAQSAAVEATQSALGKLVVPSTEADAQQLDLSHPFINPVYQTLSFQIASSRTRLAALERQQREMLGTGKLGNARFDQLSELYRRTGELSRLENNLDLARKIHADLTVRYEQTRSESVGSMVQLQIVDEAATPDRPMPRQRGQSTVLGFAAGFICAAFWALARDHGRGV